MNHIDLAKGFIQMLLSLNGLLKFDVLALLILFRQLEECYCIHLGTPHLEWMVFS